jgi:hypothetical protein
LNNQIEVKITLKGNNNSLKVHENYFCNGTKKTVYAVLKALEISGEAAKNIPDTLERQTSRSSLDLWQESVTK